MKQFYQIDLIEEYPNVNFYSIRLEDEELTELYRRISGSAWWQAFHNQPVTGLMNDPNGFVWHDPD